MMRRSNKWYQIIGANLLVTASVVVAAASGNDWSSYHGDAAGTHYSTLRQIDRKNVSKLREVWRYESPDAGPTQSTPLIVDGVMYVVSAKQKVIALDATNGKVRWIFDSGVGTGNPTRGLAWWSEGDQRRVYASVGPYIYSIDAKTGVADKVSVPRGVSICVKIFAGQPKTMFSRRRRRRSCIKIF
jgi:glucose dehydrogenase